MGVESEAGSFALQSCFFADGQLAAPWSFLATSQRVSIWMPGDTHLRSFSLLPSEWSFISYPVYLGKGEVYTAWGGTQVREGTLLAWYQMVFTEHCGWDSFGDSYKNGLSLLLQGVIHNRMAANASYLSPPSPSLRRISHILVSQVITPPSYLSLLAFNPSCL